MKNLKPWILGFWALGLALAGSFPQEARFNAPVNLQITGGAPQTGLALPLDVVLEALAKSVGLKPLIYRAYPVDGDPAKAQPPLPSIRLDFQGKPFREVWDLLFTTYGVQYNLDYLFLPPDTVVVAPSPIILSLVDAPDRSGKTERKAYLVGIPERVYLITETTQQGQRVVASVDGAKAWIQNDLLPFLSREAPGLGVNWIVVEEGGRFKALLSILATAEQHARFSDLLQRAGIDFRLLLSTTAPKPKVEKTFALTYATFPELLAFLQVQLPGVQITPFPTDPRRAVAVGTEEDLARLEALLKEADQPRGVRKVYLLQNATYAELEEKLKALIKDKLPSAQIAPVPGNPKALILEATQQDQDLFADLLKALDLPPTAPPPPQEATQRRIYTLRFADPAALAPFLAREVPGVVIQTVPGQKALAVRGTEKQLAEIEALLAQIDRGQEAVPVFQRTYQLSNAKASDLAKVLQDALKARAGGQAQAQGQPAQGQAPAQPTGPQTTVVADERTNTLIVTGPAEDLTLVEGLIGKLDQAVPQVNLRVRIQEVSSTLSRTLGLNWNTLAGGNVAASILNGSLSLIFNSTQSLAALNIIATLEALQKQGLSRALRDVNQTVLNNQTAKLQSGQTFLVRRVNTQTNPPTVEKVPFDVGIIVEVTPQITADGQILLNIRAEVSGNVQRNPVDGDVDQFDKQVVTTTLRVRDGETVVLGGLTSQEKSQSVQGVPLLMDIPLIGELFKYRTGQDTDRELLVVITADILKDRAAKP